MEQGVIYRKTDGLFDYCGWPTVARDENGKIYVVCSGHRLGHVCPYGENYMFISDDNAKSWWGPLVINNSRFDDRDGGIAAYAYLGDVGNSVTGDKKTQKFEDDYLDELVDVIKAYGFDAITYMPTRNTPEQLARLTKLCDDHGFFQISGEDINSPRQSFRCKALDDPAFGHLIDATYTLISYENMASQDMAAAKEKYAHLFR